MALVKICKSCGEQNAPSANLCSRCMANLSGIKPVDPEAVECSTNEGDPSLDGAPCPPSESGGGEERVLDASATVHEQERTLRLAFAQGGKTISLRPGDVLGREGTWKRSFDGYPTVSRKHARIAYDKSHWTLEDLRSTNGTWVNGKRLEEGVPCFLRKGDIVSLSKSCDLSVQ